MRRFTTLSITMLAGLVVGPACGAVIGIEDHQLDTRDGGPATNDAGGATDEPDGASTAVDSGDDRPLPTGSCDKGACLFFGGTCRNDVCERSCGALCPKTFICQKGQECLLSCEGDGCKNLRCSGEGSCTIDCTKATCEGATCEAQKCTFFCGPGNACKNIACRGDNRECAQQCSNPGGEKECKPPVSCCADNDDDDDDDRPFRRICPPKSECHG